MSIKEIGYLDFFGEKCVYIQDDMDYILAPVNEEARIYRHLLDKNYLLRFSNHIDKNCIVSVKEALSEGFNSIRLKLNYVFKGLNDYPIDGFVMVGNEIDEFFSPLEYYFRQKKYNQYKPSDLLYNQDKIAMYEFTCEGKQVQIELVYGNVLREGIRTDLTLHPQLVVRFDGTNDTDFVFHVASTIIKFLQFVHRKISYNLKSLELFHNTESGPSNIGYMFETIYNRDYRARSRIDASFVYYNNKIGNILSIIAAEDSFPLKHLDSAVLNSYYYSTDRLWAVSAAFEYEYSKNALYPQKGEGACLDIKNIIIDFVDQLKIDYTSSTVYLEQVKNSINRTGSQPGLKTKILNAYFENAKALEKSLPLLLPRCNTVNKVASKFADLRGKILHRETDYLFDDFEVECIRFVEILQFVMVLKRAQYTDAEIELILGPLYNCNDEYINQLMSDA